MEIKTGYLYHIKDEFFDIALKRIGGVEIDKVS